MKSFICMIIEERTADGKDHGRMPGVVHTWASKSLFFICTLQNLLNLFPKAQFSFGQLSIW